MSIRDFVKLIINLLLGLGGLAAERVWKGGKGRRLAGGISGSAHRRWKRSAWVLHKCAALVLVERKAQFVSGVHHHGAVPGDGLPKRLS